MSDKILKFRKGETVARHSTFTVALLCLLKGFVGLLSGSIALLADAINSLSDVFANFAVYVGLRLAQKEPSEKFSYGYYKAETLATLIVSIIIIIAGAEIIREAVLRFLYPSSISYHLYALLAASMSSVVSYFLARYKENTGMEINSQSLIAGGKDSRIDAYASMLVFVGVAAAYLGYFWIEPLAGLVISIFVLRIGVRFGKDAVLILMDSVLKPEYLTRIKQIAENIQGVKEIHSIKMRSSGPFLIGEMHVAVEEKMAVEKAHRISEEIENQIKKSIPEVDSLTIHIEPAKKEKLRVAIPVEEDRD